MEHGHECPEGHRKTQTGQKAGTSFQIVPAFFLFYSDLFSSNSDLARHFLIVLVSFLFFLVGFPSPQMTISLFFGIIALVAAMR